MRRLPAVLSGLAVALGVQLTGAAPAGATTIGGAGFGAVPDGPSACNAPGPARDVTFAVSGVVGPLSDVRVSGLTFSPAHAFTGDLVVTLIAPNGTQHVVFGRTGAKTSGEFGDASKVAGPYTFADSAAGAWWSASAAAGSTAIPSGSYRTSALGGSGGTGATTSMTTAFAGVSDPNGTWTLRLTDRCQVSVGSVAVATLVLVGDCSAKVAAESSAQGAVGAATAAAGTAAATVATAEQQRAQAQKKVAKKKKA